jgi:leucyl/phenylalanyl-tRNA--protein transferase
LIQELSRNNFLFPHPNEANEDGIVAWGGDLHPIRLLHAYNNGIFPWFSKNQPILWWSPDPRFIMELDEFKLRRSLQKKMKRFTYSFDKKFKDVIEKCSQTPRKDQEGTWITKEVIDSYMKLHEMGITHSVECYFEGELVGGLYGLVIGKVFCGESMFSEMSDASKAAYAILIKHLKIWGYDMVDCQVFTEHLESLGAKEISREYFLHRLQENRIEELAHRWEMIE